LIIGQLKAAMETALKAEADQRMKDDEALARQMAGLSSSSLPTTTSAETAEHLQHQV
jgi:hypothetical protein